VVLIVPDSRVPHTFDSISRRITLVIAGVMLAGCATPPVPDLSVRTPEAWSQSPTPAAPPAQMQEWWKALHDPALDALVGEALNKNLDIAQAAKRLQRERILAGHARAHFLPVFSAGARSLQDLSTADDYFQASLDMVWELGLFGAAESTRLAANADLHTAQARGQGTRVAVVAAVVRAYLELKTARYQASLFANMQTLDEQADKLAQVRLRAHINEADEPVQITMRAAQARAARAQALEAADTAALSLAVLLGRETPDPVWAEAAAEPTEPEFTLTQLPADLLRTRPDIQVAEAEVLRAAAVLGLARSALYPRFALSGAFTYSYNLTRSSHVSGDNTPSFGPVIDIPLWDWGLRRAQVDADEQELDAALLGYHKAVLDGVAEVQGALAALARQHERAAAYEEVLKARQAGQQSQGVLLSQGLSSQFDGLGERRAVLEARIELASARAAQEQAFVALYKALGGAPLPPAEAMNP
jgi:NodT family efflux transporter outer membrane factor (OMF) lipoprotein